MKNLKVLILGAILLVATMAWANYATPKPTPVKTWEYKIVYTASEDELNHQGTQGWELTAAYSSGSTPYCIFKRPK